jgi:uncharacterized membrane protein
MKLMLCIIWTTAVLALAGPAVADSPATVHGAVYSLDTLEPLNNTIIYVNSTPTQYIVAKNGLYSLELAEGNYDIIARFYKNNVLTYSIEETIEIKNGGNYVFDLVLPSVYSTELVNGSNIPQQLQKPVTGNFKPNVGSQISPKTENTPILEDIPVLSNLVINSRTIITKQGILYSLIINCLLIALTLLLLFIGGYRLPRRNKQTENNTSQEGIKGNIISDLFKFLNIPRNSIRVMDKNIGLERKGPKECKEGYPAQETELAEFGSEEEDEKTYLEESAYNPEIETPDLKKKPLLSPDLQEVLDIIQKQGGNITQKNLRGRLKYSEVKVCLMLNKLEKRKMIKKFKRGRENIVVLIARNR